ncbi:hypothetical protein BU23DRAFT_572150 [Bimuria novae-zelandiae CBS 107.79]|uniref:Uncharacterized protein n=1 Tax=Bimuria novae-zelandiae CBS 107.79 TaxID=1447943 RepID=A0A6A5UU73_9PLEO|nr:hypothetical protein BU23DRAFT_572150 [Bimuria novae-zelandiae CBS 107.79]
MDDVKTCDPPEGIPTAKNTERVKLPAQNNLTLHLNGPGKLRKDFNDFFAINRIYPVIGCTDSMPDETHKIYIGDPVDLNKLLQTLNGSKVKFYHCHFEVHHCKFRCSLKDADEKKFKQKLCLPVFNKYTPRGWDWYCQDPGCIADAENRSEEVVVQEQDAWAKEHNPK